MLLAACWFSASAQAQTANADAKNGASIAQNGLPPAVAACASCHGAQGEGMAAFPPLAGQAGGYLRSLTGGGAVVINGRRTRRAVSAQTAMRFVRNSCHFAGSLR